MANFSNQLQITSDMIFTMVFVMIPVFLVAGIFALFRRGAVGSSPGSISTVEDKAPPLLDLPEEETGTVGIEGRATDVLQPVVFKETPSKISLLKPTSPLEE